MVLTRTLTASKARDIQERIDCGLDLWEIGIHKRRVRDLLAEGRAREKMCREKRIRGIVLPCTHLSQYLTVGKAASGGPSGHQP